MSGNPVLAVAQARRAQQKPGSGTGGGPRIWPEILALIETGLRNQPRGLQKEIGPSELGTDSLHTLAAKLAGWPQRHGPSWLPFVGTAVHSRFEHYFPTLNKEGEEPRFETERRVTVGRLNGLAGGYDVTGSIDLYDHRNAATIDWKIVGPTTLRQVKAHGVSQQYRVQASLYGTGLHREHLPIRTSCIYFLPRNAVSLNDAIAWEADWDPRPGRWALARAQLLVNIMDLIEESDGTRVRDAWIHQLPESPTHDFNDGAWPDDNPLDLATGEQPSVPGKWTRFIPLIEPTYKQTTTQKEDE